MNDGSVASAAHDIASYRKSGGDVLGGLVARRNREGHDRIADFGGRAETDVLEIRGTGWHVAKRRGDDGRRGDRLLANGSVALMLYRFRGGDANMRSVWICSRNDAIGNVAVLLAAAGRSFAKPAGSSCMAGSRFPHSAAR